MKKITLIIATMALCHSMVFSQGCLPEGIAFTTQAQIDNFQSNYPGCTEIEGEVTIRGNDITDLLGLDIMTSIGGDFTTAECENLYNLVGLDNLQMIGGSVNFGFGTMGGSACTYLVSLTGLENLNSIGGDINFYCNILLQELSGLSGLTSIGGNLWIYDNPVLQSLTGLENIEAGSISNLNISGNYQLSTCEVQSICDYLAAPSGNVNISNNAPGCDSKEEVQEACWIVHIEEGQASENQFTFYPNPVSDKITLNCSGMKENIELIEIYNTFGARVAAYRVSQKDAEITFDVQVLPPGIYIIRLQAGNEGVVKKVVKL